MESRTRNSKLSGRNGEVVTESQPQVSYKTGARQGQNGNSHLKDTHEIEARELTKMERLKITLRDRQRWLVAAVVIVALAALGFYYWGNRASAADYMTAKVERGNLRNTVTATGTLQAVTTVQVGSQASGTISALYADFNSKVKKGQVIAQLDPAQAQAQVAQARANLEQAQAAVRQASANAGQSRAGVAAARAKASAAGSTVQNEQAGVNAAQANVAVLQAQMNDAASFLRQQQSLAANGVIAQRDLETAQTNYATAQARYNQAIAQLNQSQVTAQSAGSAGTAQAQAELQQAQAQAQQGQAAIGSADAQVQQAQAALDLAEINLKHLTITSPIDGIVVSRNVDVGQTVAASLSAPTLFTIAQDLTQMQVIANIDQADIGLVEQAKSASFTVDAFPGQEFNGTIQQVRLNPQTAQNVVTYNVVIDVSNPQEKLKPGMTANLTITIDERNNVIKVPNAALRYTPQAATGQGGQNGNFGQGQRQGQRRNAGQQSANENGAATDGSNAPDTSNAQGDGTRGNFAPPTAPVLAGQTRRVWVLGADGKPQPRRIKIGLTDGSYTEVVEGDLKEGDLVITGQTLAASKQNTNQTTPPGFGGAPRGGPGGGRPPGR
jgi:HlyD family secretion protein